MVYAFAPPEDEVARLEGLLKEAKSKVATVVTAPVVATKKTDEERLSQHLQDISVTILSPSDTPFSRGGEGSGVIKTRVRGNDTINFVWTAAHVVDNLRHVRQVIDPKTGTPRSVVEFSDAKVIKELREDGRTVGKLEMFASVIRFSAEEDLALLRIRKTNFVKVSADFYLEDNIPSLGTNLYHVGSLLGQLGSNSMTPGIMSQHGRLINKKIFDQTTVGAFPGSSGGGVYLHDGKNDGKLIGILVRGAGETFNLIVPVRRIREWAKEAKVEWALDDRIPLPSEEELKKMQLEDVGINFSYTTKTVAPDGGVGAPKIIGKGVPYLGDEEKNYPVMLRMDADPAPQ
jgi:S1-C subfamily serine protease